MRTIRKHFTLWSLILPIHGSVQVKLEFGNLSETSVDQNLLLVYVPMIGTVLQVSGHMITCHQRNKSSVLKQI